MQRAIWCTRRFSRTCTFLMRPCVTRSMAIPAQRQVLSVACISKGAVASRRQALATQPNMTRAGTSGEYSADMQPRGRRDSRPCCLLPVAVTGERRAESDAADLTSSSARNMCARCSAGERGSPSGASKSAAVVPVKWSVHDRSMVDWLAQLAALDGAASSRFALLLDEPREKFPNEDDALPPIDV